MWRFPAMVLSALLLFTAAMGCVTAQLPVAGSDAPVRHVIRASQYAFTTDFPIERDDPLIDELVELRDVVFDTLKLPAGRLLVRVVIFENQQSYDQFIRLNFPDLPSRRAFFIKQDNDQLVVYAARGERLLQDLRHEVTHALLHSVLPTVPLWLDEGLAEYFEAQPKSGYPFLPHRASACGRTPRLATGSVPPGATG